MSVFGQYENAHYITAHADKSKSKGQGFKFERNGEISFFNLPTADQVIDEAVSTLSDRDGNMLLFANHDRLFNRDMTVAKNGRDLEGYFSSNTQFFIRADDRFVYLFQVKEDPEIRHYNGNGILIYSVVDLELDGGKGGIVSGVKNVELLNDVTEGMTVIPGECGTVWIVARKLNDELVAVEFDGQSFGKPVFSRVIRTQDKLDSIYNETFKDNYRSSFLYHAEYRKMVHTIRTMGIIEVYNFNPYEGKFDNPEVLENWNFDVKIMDYDAPYMSCEFDSTGEFLITGENYPNDSTIYIVQYDFSLPNIDEIKKSKKKIAQYPINNSSAFNHVIKHPITHDFYWTSIEPRRAFIEKDSWLWKMNCDEAWNCVMEPYKMIPNHVRFPISLASRSIAQNSLPSTFLPEDTILCDPTNFELSISATDYDSVVWSDGYRGDRRLVEQPGVYSATIYKGGCDRTDDIEIKRTDDSPLMPSSRVDLCESGSVSAIDGGVYHWSDGSVGSSIQVDRSGSYWVENRTVDCVQRDSFEVVIEAFEVVLSDSYMLCEGESVTLEPDIGNATSPKYRWSTGATMPSIEVDSAGVYSVEVESGQGCRSHTSTMVEQEERVRIELLRDTTICTGSILEVSYNDELVRWSTGEVSRKLFMDRSDIISGIGVESCIEIAPFEIGIQDCEPETPADCVVSIPNALMRSSEDINRSFLVFSTCDGMDVKYEVFDRWGNVMFRGIGEQRWLPESDVNTGVYVVKLSYRTDSMLPYKIKYGTIHVF